VQTGRYHIIMRELHDKYGPIVRIGPNLLDIDMPEVIKTIYGSDPKWRKVWNPPFLPGYANSELFRPNFIKTTVLSSMGR
jgi:hypothetical protein